ncbi:protein disulfide-isomerase tmx3a-like isoform X2 [Convolutriloba macropyga]|uniref:protein disulfide-isomerase tmx3a-like isoform X2 n=1 Tax=Convolutriloba macropyga TaxID=536237 RepID=UPI003F5211EA
MSKLHNSAYLLLGFMGLCALLYLPPRVECFGAVLELGPDFLLKKAEGGMWFIKFYAPWCGYCKKLEPTWNELEKRVRTLGVVVGRIDATRFEELAHQFEIRGFPTLIFFKGDKQFTYSGPRTLDNLEEFVKRVSGPAVDEIATVGQFVQLRHSEKPFFLYYGDLSPISPLYDAFRTVADSMQEKTYFKSLQKTEYLPNDMKSDDHFIKNSVAVVKGATFYKFEEPSENVCKLETKHEECVDTLMLWIKKERLPNYTPVTPETFHDFQSSGNMLAIAIVPESAPNSDSVFKWTKRISEDFRPSYSTHFSFGFMRDPKMFHDITLDSSVEFPNLFVLDTSTDHYYIPEVKSSELTEGSMMHFLDDVKSGKVEPRGGSSFFRKFRRAFHELSKALSELFSVSMVLALLVLSVPLIVVSCLCYLLCTMDTSDEGAHSEDEEDEARRQGSVEDGMGHYEAIHGAEAVEGLRQRGAVAGDAEDESDI